MALQKEKQSVEKTHVGLGTPFLLTIDQQEAVASMPERNVQIVACAGSGKTEVIARGIAEIIRQKAKPASVVAFTFTEKAAEELKARIRHLLRGHGSMALGEMYAGTIHSYCFETLKRLRSEYRGYDVLDEASRIAYLSKPDNFYTAIGLVALQKEKGLGKFKTISQFIGAYEIVLNEGIDPEELAGQEPTLAKCINKYRAALNDDHYLDFSSMIHELVKLLESNDSEAVTELHSAIRYLVVDEYQDINGLQERLIKAMVGNSTKITVVGDDDQGIYGWRGAGVDYIRNFSRDFSDVKTVKLQENFRSTEGIVRLTNAYIEKNNSRIPKKMQAKFSMAHQSSDIQYAHFGTERQQADFIIQRIRELLGSDFTDKTRKQFALGLGDMGILVRRNEEAARLIPYLRAAGIDCIVDSGESAFEQDIARTVLDALDWSFGVSKHSLEQVVAEYLKAVKSGGNKRTLPNRGSIEDSLSSVKKRLDRIRDRGNRDYLPDLGLQGVFHELLAALGIPKIDLTDGEHLYLASISQAVSDYEKVWQRLRHGEYKYFRGFVTAWGKHSYSVPGTPLGGLTGGVKIMTIHKAKGLEFPVVFIPYLIQTQVRHRPSLVPDELYDDSHYQPNPEDDRRVYYVALTRAQKYLFLSGMREDPTVKKPRAPATVMEELEPTLLFPPTPLVPPRSELEERHGDHSFSTTFSELSAFGRCGYDYKLRHYYGYNAGVPAFFGYGTQIHNILALIHTKYRDQELTDAEIENLVNRNFYLRYAPGAMADSARTAAEKVVRNYVHHYSKEFPTILDTEKSFEAALGDTLITGQIDLIKEVDPSTDDVKKVAVIDFKSDSELLYKADSKHQVRLYVEAARQALGLHPVKAAIHDLDAGEEKEVDIQSGRIEETLDELKERIAGIRARRYTPVKAPKVCGACDYCRICRHAAS